MTRLLAPPAPPRADISEDDLQRLVVDLAAYCGWLCWHDNDSRTNAAGLPDLLLLRKSRMLWRELKTARGRVRPEQADFGARLLAAGQDWAIWRPADWTIIVETLTAEE